MIPGMNLLNLALTAIAPQTIVLYVSTGRNQNERGDWVTLYEQGYPVTGSWQPVDKTKYEALGLDLQKQYFNFRTSETIKSVLIDESPDICECDGRRYSCTGDTPWGTIDGWQVAMFVDIGAAQ